MKLCPLTISFCHDQVLLRSPGRSPIGGENSLLLSINEGLNQGVVMSTRLSPVMLQNLSPHFLAWMDCQSVICST